MALSTSEILILPHVWTQLYIVQNSDPYTTKTEAKLCIFFLQTFFPQLSKGNFLLNKVGHSENTTLLQAFKNYMPARYHWVITYSNAVKVVIFTIFWICGFCAKFGEQELIPHENICDVLYTYFKCMHRNEHIYYIVLLMYACCMFLNNLVHWRKKSITVLGCPVRKN